jgi:hypothetical protein
LPSNSTYRFLGALDSRQAGADPDVVLHAGEGRRKLQVRRRRRRPPFGTPGHDRRRRRRLRQAGPHLPIDGRRLLDEAKVIQILIGIFCKSNGKKMGEAKQITDLACKYQAETEVTDSDKYPFL